MNNSNDKKRDLNYLRNFTFEIGSYKKNKKKKLNKNFKYQDKIDETQDTDSTIWLDETEYYIFD